MPKLPWFRLYTEILDDPKLAELTDAQFRDWMYVLAMAREAGDSGDIPMSVERAAWRCRRPADDFRRSLEVFERLGMVTLAEAGIHVVHFAERQNDKPSAQAARVRERVRRHREKAGNADVTPEKRAGNADVTPEKRAGNADVTPEKRPSNASETPGPGIVKRPCNATDKIRLEESRGEKSRGEKTEKETSSPPPDLTRQERDLLNALSDIADHRVDFETDLRHVRKWLVRFPNLSLLDEIDRCVTWWNGPRAPRQTGRPDWRSRIRNWLQKQEDIRKEREARGFGHAPQSLAAPPSRPPARDLTDVIRANTAHLEGYDPPVVLGEAAAASDDETIPGGEPQP